MISRRLAIALAAAIAVATLPFSPRLAWGAPETRIAPVSAEVGAPVSLPFLASHLGVRWTGDGSEHLEVRWQSASGAWSSWEHAERNPDSSVGRAVHRIGHEIQRLVSTREPTAEQVEVGVAALTAVGTVAEAVQWADQQTFDLLISDIGLPDGTGTELIDILRDDDAFECPGREIRAHERRPLRTIDRRRDGR